MHRLSSAFILGYHGCDATVAEKLLAGSAFRASQNDYDWLGPGIYFWEANPLRGLEYAHELQGLKRGPKIETPTVIGAVIDLGLCLDLTTSTGTQQVASAFRQLVEMTDSAGYELPRNSSDTLRRPLDCAVVRLLHDIREKAGDPAVDTVRGIFLEGEPVYAGSGFYAKTHVQVCVCNPDCIKGVFRVPPQHLS